MSENPDAIPLRLSVIVPTYRRPEQLSACLTALAAQEYPRDRFEVIVVDDGSGSPPTLEVEAARPLLDVLLVVRDSRGGPGAARNSGAERARGPYLAFTDDDCMPAPDWLRALAVAAERLPGHAIGGQVVNALPHNPYATASQLLTSYLYDYYAADSLRRRRFFTTNNLAVPLSFFMELGGFDTISLRDTAEDREFCDRWLHNGLEMSYAGEAIVRHAHDLTLTSFCWQHGNYGRGALYFHEARARRDAGRIVLEPLSFYTRMLRYPFVVEGGLRSVGLSALVALSQAAYACGYYSERVRRWLSAPR